MPDRFFSTIKNFGKKLVLTKEELDRIGVDKVYKATVKRTKRKLFDRPGYLGAVIVTFGIRSVFGYYFHFYKNESSAHAGFEANSVNWLTAANVTDVNKSKEDKLLLTIRNKDKKDNLISYFREKKVLVTILSASDALDLERIKQLGELLKKKLHNLDEISG